MIEVWKTIPGFEPYQASNRGRLKGKRGRVMSPSISNVGYLRTVFRIEGESVPVLVSRMVAYAFHGLPPDPEMVIDHIDGDTLNNAPENLEWVYFQENVHRGKVTKLSASTVAAMVGMRRSGAKYREISAAFGVDINTVYHAVNGLTWAQN